MQSMKALRLLDWKSDPQIVEVDRPVPGPGEALVRIGGAGACHSDLHLMHEFEGGVLPWGPPFTLGHENAGWVEELGPDTEAAGISVGSAVAVYGPWGCGRCAKCLAGVETYCEAPRTCPGPRWWRWAGSRRGDGRVHARPRRTATRAAARRS